MDSEQFSNLTEEVLKNLPYPYSPKNEDCYSTASHQLVMGTIIHESGQLQYNQQIKGPAIGFLQMEPPTFRDHKRFLFKNRHSDWGFFREAMLLRYVNEDRFEINQLKYNLAFNIAMCRLHYLRVNRPLPPANKLLPQSLYWFSWYNRGTNRNKKVKQYRDNYQEFFN